MKANPAELYYYCPDCRKFHEYGTDGKVSRYLCFICGTKGKVKTKIIGSAEYGHTQICARCAENFDLESYTP